MAFSRRQSQNMGPGGGGIAALGDGGLDAGGTSAFDVVTVGGTLTVDGAQTLTGATTFTAAAVFNGGLTTLGGVASGASRTVGGRVYNGVSAADNLLASAGASAHVDFAQTYSIPANTLGQGVALKIRYHVLVTDASGTDTLETKLYIGSTTLMTTTAFDPDAANDWVQGEFLLVPRAAAGATASCVGQGRWTSSDGGSLVHGVSLLGATNLATNGALIVKASAKWSSTTASTNARLETLFIEII